MRVKWAWFERHIKHLDNLAASVPHFVLKICPSQILKMQKRQRHHFFIFIINFGVMHIY